MPIKWFDHVILKKNQCLILKMLIKILKRNFKAEMQYFFIDASQNKLIVFYYFLYYLYDFLLLW